MLKSERVTIGTVPVKVAGPDADGMSVAVRNRGTSAIDLGDSTVAAGAGYELLPGEATSIDLGGNESLYAITSIDTQRLDTLRTRASS